MFSIATAGAFFLALAAACTAVATAVAATGSASREDRPEMVDLCRKLRAAIGLKAEKAKMLHACLLSIEELQSANSMIQGTLLKILIFWRIYVWKSCTFTLEADPQKRE